MDSRDVIRFQKISFRFRKKTNDPLVLNFYYRFELLFKTLLKYRQRSIQGGGIGAKPPPGPMKSIDFRGFSWPNGC